MKDEIPELFAPEQSAPPPALTLRDVLTVLFRRKWLILGCFALVAGLAGAALYLLPPTYVSEAKVLVKTEQEGGPAFFSGLAGYREGRDLDPPNRKIETELAIFSVRPLSEAVVRELGIQYAQVYHSPIVHLADRAEAAWHRVADRLFGATEPKRHGMNETALEFGKSLTVQPLRSRSADTTSNVLHLSMKAHDPMVAEKALALLLQHYVSYGSVLHERFADKAARSLGNSLYEAEATLKEAQQRLNRFVIERGVVLTRTAGPVRYTTMAEEPAAAAGAAGGAAAAAAVSAPPRALVPEVSFGDDGALMALKSRLTQLELQLADARSQFTDNSGRVVALRMQIGQLKRRLAAETRRNAENETVTMALQRELRVAEEAYLDLKRRKTQVDMFRQVNLAQSDARVVVEPPYLPGASDAPTKVGIWLIAALAGLLLGLATAGLAELSDRRLRTPFETLRHLGLETIGTLARFNPRRPRTPQLRTSIRNAALKLASQMDRKEARRPAGPPQQGRAIVVTSARPGEGKALVATLLAEELARITGTRVLLVDANPDNPKLHRQFGLPEEQGGFLEGLSSGAWEKAPVFEGHVPGLRLMPLGWTRQGELLYRGEALTKFSAHAARDNAITIIIGPTLAAGANLLADRADGVVLVVDASRTRREVVNGTLETSGIDRHKLLGVVLNKRDTPIPQFLYRML